MDVAALTLHLFLPAITLGSDNTYKVAFKGTIVEKNKSRSRAFKGGLITVINERNHVISWVSLPSRLRMAGRRELVRHQRFCHTQANAELEELLRGLKRRFALLGIPEPEIATVDNCCHVKNAYLNVFPENLCLRLQSAPSTQE